MRVALLAGTGTGGTAGVVPLFCVVHDPDPSLRSPMSGECPLPAHYQCSLSLRSLAQRQHSAVGKRALRQLQQSMHACQHSRAAASNSAAVFVSHLSRLSQAAAAAASPAPTILIWLIARSTSATVCIRLALASLHVLLRVCFLAGRPARGMMRHRAWMPNKTKCMHGPAKNGSTRALCFSFFFLFPTTTPAFSFVSYLLFFRFLSCQLLHSRSHSDMEPKNSYTN